MRRRDVHRGQALGHMRHQPALVAEHVERRERRAERGDGGRPSVVEVVHHALDVVVRGRDQDIDRMILQQPIERRAIARGVARTRDDMRCHARGVEARTIGVGIGDVQLDGGIVGKRLDVIDCRSGARQHQHVGHAESLWYGT